MEKHVYRFAGHAVEISSLYPYVHKMCRDYRTNDAAELFLSVSQSDTDYERQRAAKTGPENGARDRRRLDPYLESLGIYRKLAEALIPYGVLLFHGSAVAVDGVCYIFAARSGTGKSTHARYWRELLGSRAVMVNDDKPLITVTPAGATVWGTPWDGKHRLSRNISVPLRAICLLERGDANTITPITPKDAWPVLWRQTYRPADPDNLRRTVALTDALSRSAALYRLRCRPEPAAARLAYGAMSKGEHP